MMTADQVETVRQQLIADGVPKPDMIRQLATDCLGWPYVFGAWGEMCTPANRKRRVRDDHPTIKSKCPALNGKSCAACQWGLGCRMYDCRGFTRWLLQQVGLDITGSGATSQYNTAANWALKGPIAEMPNVVCCVFKHNTANGKMEHTGMHVGNGQIIHCSTNVRTGKTTDKGWTHFAVPAGLYGGGEIPVVKPTLRKGAKGDLVAELQTKLTALGFDPGMIDGIFGTKTFNALTAFQTEAKLDVDGVCGPKTWAALDEATNTKPAEPETTYKVTCYGMTWDQSMAIREICPVATMEKER